MTVFMDITLGQAYHRQFDTIYYNGEIVIDITPLGDGFSVQTFYNQYTLYANELVSIKRDIE